MPKKTIANNSDQTGTEYFVTYFQTLYPKCRCTVVTWDWSNKGLQKFQKTMPPCFESYCEKADCREKGCFCHWNQRKSDPTGLAEWDEYSECQHQPCQCITVPCLKARRVLCCTAPIGLLTPDELKVFAKLAGIKNTDTYLLRSQEEIDGLSIEEKMKHNRAIERFKQEAKDIEPTEGFLVIGEGVGYLYRFARIADRIRAASNLSAQTTLPKTTDESAAGNTSLSKDAQFIAEHIKRLDGYQGSPSLTLADLKPPREKNGQWFSMEKTEEILNDVLISKKCENIRYNSRESKKNGDIVNDIEELKKTHKLAKSALRTRRQGVPRLLDEQTGYWHSKDSKGVFFRFKRKNEAPEYFILGKKDNRFSREYPKLVDSASDSPPLEAELLKKIKK